jgi:hypothetical protein
MEKSIDEEFPPLLKKQQKTTSAKISTFLIGLRITLTRIKSRRPTRSGIFLLLIILGEFL